MSVVSPTSSNSGESYSWVDHWLIHPNQSSVKQLATSVCPPPTWSPFPPPSPPLAFLVLTSAWGEGDNIFSSHFLFHFHIIISYIAVFLSDACFQLSIELSAQPSAPAITRDCCYRIIATQRNSVNAMQLKAIHTANVTPATMIIHDGAYQPMQMSLFTFVILNRRSPPPQLLDTTEEQTSPHHRLNQVCLWNNLLFDNSWNNFNSNEIWGNAKEISLGQTCKTPKILNTLRRKPINLPPTHQKLILFFPCWTAP